MQTPRSKLKRQGLIATGVAALAAVAVVGIWTSAGNRTSDATAAAVERGETGSVAASAGEPVSPPQPAAMKSRPSMPARTAAISTPLPPPGTPLAKIYADLQERADAGDAQAASRLYHDVHRCLMARKYKQHVKQALPLVLDRESKDVSADQLKHQDDMLRMLQEQIDFVQNNAALCAEASDEQLNSFVPLSLQAAQLGDLKALDCYVGESFFSMPGLLDHPEWLTQYKQNAPALVDAAMRRGDWVVVELVRHAYSGTFSDSARGQLFGADPVMNYRYLQLERLGASGAFIGRLDTTIVQAAADLTPQQLSDAEGWAQDTYARYFNNSSSNEVSNGANICQMMDD